MIQCMNILYVREMELKSFGCFACNFVPMVHASGSMVSHRSNHGHITSILCPRWISMELTTNYICRDVMSIESNMARGVKM